MQKIFLFFMLIVLFTACNNGAQTENTIKDSSKIRSLDTATRNGKEILADALEMAPSKNIIENITISQNHTTFIAAVKAGGLEDTLSHSGPFTVFAPTNDAFNKLSTGTFDNLLKPGMKKELARVLTYHVVPGTFKTTDLKNGQKLKTVQGDSLNVSIKDGRIMIGGAHLAITDIVSSNGITHVIDSVLLPAKH